MLTVTGEVRDNGMLPVLLGSVAGYVSSDYVYVTDEALATATPAPNTTPTPTPEPASTPIENPTPETREATVTAYGGLKLRQMPDMSSGTLADHAVWIGRNGDGRSGERLLRGQL